MFNVQGSRVNVKLSEKKNKKNKIGDEFSLTDANSLPESNSDLITALTGLDVNNFSDHIVSLLLVTFNVELLVK